MRRRPLVILPSIWHRKDNRNSRDSSDGSFLVCGAVKSQTCEVLALRHDVAEREAAITYGYIQLPTRFGSPWLYKLSVLHQRNEDCCQGRYCSAGFRPPATQYGSVFVWSPFDCNVAKQIFTEFKYTIFQASFIHSDIRLAWNREKLGHDQVIAKNSSRRCFFLFYR